MNRPEIEKIFDMAIVREIEARDFYNAVARTAHGHPYRRAAHRDSSPQRDARTAHNYAAAQCYA